MNEHAMTVSMCFVIIAGTALIIAIHVQLDINLQNQKRRRTERRRLRRQMEQRQPPQGQFAPQTARQAMQAPPQLPGSAASALYQQMVNDPMFQMGMRKPEIDLNEPFWTWHERKEDERHSAAAGRAASKIRQTGGTFASIGARFGALGGGHIA